MQVDYNSKPLPDGQIKTLIRWFKIMMQINHTAANICCQNNISRKTYYRRIDNYAQDGVLGLLDKSRAHHSHPLTKPEDIQDRIIRLATDRPELGYKKIFRIHCNDDMAIKARTVQNILKKNKLNTYFLRKQRNQESLRMAAEAEEYY